MLTKEAKVFHRDIFRALVRLMALPPVMRMPLATQIADIRDYFMWITIDAWDHPEKSRELVREFAELGSISEKVGNYFLVGFFFTLENLLSLRHGIIILPGEKINRESFEESFRRTLEYLKIKYPKKIWVK